MAFERVVQMEHAPMDADYYCELYYRCLSALPHDAQRRVADIALPLWRGPNCTVIEVHEVAKLAATDPAIRGLIYEAMQEHYNPGKEAEA